MCDCCGGGDVAMKGQSSASSCRRWWSIPGKFWLVCRVGDEELAIVFRVVGSYEIGLSWRPRHILNIWKR